MPAVAPLPPAAIRQLLEEHGYEIVAEDDFNWAFAKTDTDEPVMVPHRVDLVPLEVAFHVAQRVGFDDYFEKLHQVRPEANPDRQVH